MVRIVPNTEQEARIILTRLSRELRSAPEHKIEPKLGEQNQFRCLALVPSERAGREISNDLAKAACAAGWRLLNPIEIPPRSTDARVVVMHALENRPDAVLLWLPVLSAARIAKQLREAGFIGYLAGPSSLASASFTNAAEEGAEGFVVPCLALDHEAECRWREFTNEFQRRFSAEANRTAVMAHDAALLIINRSRRSDEAAARCFPITLAVTGATGPLNFDRLGNRTVTLRSMICHQGRFAPWPNEEALTQPTTRHSKP
jgi:ABC-type branched-subunit amino acid transport system substrate-binding protein